MHILFGMALICAGVMLGSTWGGGHTVLGACLLVPGLISFICGLFINYWIYKDSK